MVIDITSTNEYRLYVTKEANKLKVSSALKKTIVGLLMHSFNDGMKFDQRVLRVKV